jgi:hypothetical protein
MGILQIIMFSICLWFEQKTERNYKSIYMKMEYRPWFIIRFLRKQKRLWL